MGPRLEGTRDRAGALQERVRRLGVRVDHERERHESLDAAFRVLDRDVEVGGGIIAGALAYRLFVWLLPFALVLVAGLGIAADASDATPREAARDLGLAGLVSSSVASASRSSGRWYALLVGIPVLVYVTRSLLRALVVAHRLVWRLPRADVPRPTARATAAFLGLLLAFFAVSALAGAARSASLAPGILVSLLVALPYALIWLGISTALPHRPGGATTLLPGAALVACGIEVLHLATAYVLAPMALNKQGTYGALGIAAGLLLGLFLIGRLIVASAVLNATLWERSARRAEARAAAQAPAAATAGVRPSGRPSAGSRPSAAAASRKTSRPGRE